MIPKIIYFTWISEKPIPEKYKQYIASWKRIMPDYKVKQISLKNIKRGEFVDKAIKIKNYALAGHYARVQELYLTGGIYLDIDVQAIKRFDSLLHNKMVIGAEDDHYINNAMIVAEKGHPFLKECMDFMDKVKFDLDKIELSTGPHMFTQLMKKRGWTNGAQGRFGDVAVLPPEYFYPYPYHQRFAPECITKNTFSVHHWAFSWNPRVSIVIPCYKQAHYLSDAIQSAINQIYKDIEIIVVNDGSPDNTSDVARKFKQVKLIEQANAGLSAARNAGIKAATGGWILTLDADDKIDPTFIEKTIRKADIVSTKVQNFGDSTRKWEPPTLYPKHEDFLRHNQINCCSLFKKDAWAMVGGYDEKMKLGFEDWDFWIRATGAGFNVAVVPEHLFFYRKHGPSMVTEANNNRDKIKKYMRTKYALL